MKLIVGLGNPGKKYEKTRHNIGFKIVDALAGTDQWKKNKKANCFYIKKQINGQETEIIKPLSFMNNSGIPVKYVQKKHNLKTENIIVVHDDIDLALGKLKICQNRSSAGHKGVQSIIDHLKTKNFIRFRIGIGEQKNKKTEKQRNKKATEKFVLGRFNKDEQKRVNQIIKLTTEAVCSSLQQGVKRAMSIYNHKPC